MYDWNLHFEVGKRIEELKLENSHCLSFLALIWKDINSNNWGITTKTEINPSYNRVEILLTNGRSRKDSIQYQDVDTAMDLLENL